MHESDFATLLWLKHNEQRGGTEGQTDEEKCRRRRGGGCGSTCRSRSRAAPAARNQRGRRNRSRKAAEEERRCWALRWASAGVCLQHKTSIWARFRKCCHSFIRHLKGKHVLHMARVSQPTISKCTYFKRIPWIRTVWFHNLLSWSLDYGCDILIVASIMAS